MKPQPHLLDVINPHRDFPDKGYKKAVDFVLAHQRDARRFIFDAEASLYLGHFIRECGDLILLNRQFAIPPFETTYVEVQIQKVHEGIGKTTSNDIWGSTTADTQVGFLVRNHLVYTLAANDYSNGSTVGLFSYWMNYGHWRCGPVFREPYVPSDPNDHWLRSGLLLGTSIDDLPDEETRSQIIHTNGIVYVADYQGDTPHVNVWSSMGELRTLWAALLLINQNRHVETVHVPWQSGILRGKRHVYAAHNLVRINLSGRPIRKVFLPAMVHQPRRRHEVKGHFMHWDCVAHCIHQWPGMPEIGPNERARWQCVKCGGWRTWRKDHMRGDGGVGVVTKEYHVTDSER